MRYGIQKCEVGRGYWVVAKVKHGAIVATRRLTYFLTRGAAVRDRNRRNRLEKQIHRRFVRAIRQKT